MPLSPVDRSASFSGLAWTLVAEAPDLTACSLKFTAFETCEQVQPAHWSPTLWNRSHQGILWSPGTYFWCWNGLFALAFKQKRPHSVPCPPPHKRVSLEGLALPFQTYYLILLLLPLLPGFWGYSTLKSVIGTAIYLEPGTLYSFPTCTKLGLASIHRQT